MHGSGLAATGLLLAQHTRQPVTNERMLVNNEDPALCATVCRSLHLGIVSTTVSIRRAGRYDPTPDRRGRPDCLDVRVRAFKSNRADREKEHRTNAKTVFCQSKA